MSGWLCSGSLCEFGSVAEKQHLYPAVRKHLDPGQRAGAPGEHRAERPTRLLLSRTRTHGISPGPLGLEDLYPQLGIGASAGDIGVGSEC
ncbi:hypothetical protein YWIDRAFT_05154 [Streptomyces sp. SceaMP-e96]|nr:hypothetical protein YWIDRAFT_05154 [Streptomyces sp. SceaMP-e96]